MSNLPLLTVDEYVNQIHVSDALTYVSRLPDNSVNCVVTSPPYFNQRDYGVDGQIGAEALVKDYVVNLVAIFDEVKRALKPDGTVWVNLGDSYSSGGRGGGDQHTAFIGEYGKQQSIGRKKIEGFPPKSLCAAPWRFAIAMQDAGWTLRADIIWEKPNAMPSSAVDRPAISHEYLFLFSKSRKYFYDKDAILEPYTKPMNRWGGDVLTADGESLWDKGTGQASYRNRNMRPNPNGRNARTVWRPYSMSSKRDGSIWSINTTPTSYGHFATMPQKLVEKCIIAGCPKDGIVLDPFMGSGTTAIVALKNGRRYTGSDLNPIYVTVALSRLSNMPLSQPTLF